MYQQLLHAVESLLSENLLTRTFEAGGALLLFVLALGVGLTRLGSLVVDGLAGALGERADEARASARRTTRRLGALCTVSAVLGVAALVAWSAWGKHDLARAILIEATPERA